MHHCLRGMDASVNVRPTCLSSISFCLCMDQSASSQFVNVCVNVCVYVCVYMLVLLPCVCASACRVQQT